MGQGRIWGEDAGSAPHPLPHPEMTKRLSNTTGILHRKEKKTMAPRPAKNRVRDVHPLLRKILETPLWDLWNHFVCNKMGHLFEVK